MADCDTGAALTVNLRKMLASYVAWLSKAEYFYVARRMLGSGEPSYDQGPPAKSDYFERTKGLDNIIWAYHTTQRNGALERCYPGDDYVDVLGKSAYGAGLVFSEYEWAVEKKKHGNVIWWAELGIRGKSEPARDCMDVLRKLESNFPELAGFVFWSEAGFYNVAGNLNGREFMAHPKIITLGE